VTEDWIHYFDKANYQPINIFEGIDDDFLSSQICNFHSLKQVDWTSFDLAIIGIADSRNSTNKGCSEAPNAFRSFLFNLRALSKDIRIIDLGNIRGKTIDDRYKALEEIVTELISLKVIPLILGGSQDYTFPIAKSVAKSLSSYNLSIIDSKIDWLRAEQDYSSSSYLGHLCASAKDAPNDLSVIGVQKYLYSSYQEDQIQHNSYELLRLGQIRQLGHQIAEPLLRDADILSVDINAVQQSDQPAQRIPMPNGLSGQELCQLMWYAGQSDRIKAYGIFELDISLDINKQATQLGAQAIWHILEGIALRYNDYPVKELDSYRQFIVFLDDYELEIKFYNNAENDRWWVEIPSIDDKIEVIACSRHDFETASNNEIPEKWFRFIQKNNYKSSKK